MASKSQRHLPTQPLNKPSTTQLLTTANVLSDLVDVVRPLEPASLDHLFPPPDQQISRRLFGVPLIEALALNAELSVPIVVEYSVRRLLNAPGMIFFIFLSMSDHVHKVNLI